MAMNVQAAADSDEEEDNNYDWGETEEAEREASELLCASPFFSPFMKLPSVTEACAHDEKNFGFNVKELCGNLKLDFYGGIKLINYIRTLVKERSPSSTTPLTKIDAEGMLDKVKCEVGTWSKSEEYLKPVIKDDMFLQCVDSLITEEDWSDSDSELLDQAQEASELSKVKKQLAETQAQMALMTQSLYEQTFREGNANKQGSSKGKPASETTNQVSNEVDYQSDARFLLNLEAMKFYESTFKNNGALFEDKVVLDVGCGSGLLAMLAVQAGGKKVVGVDTSSSISRARTAASLNQMPDKLHFIEGDVEELTNEQLELASASVDVIMSEWRSRCLLLSNRFAALISSRDRFLKKGGAMVPCRALVHLTGYEDESLSSLQSVCGLNMTSLEPSITSCSWRQDSSIEPVECLTSSQVLIDLNLNICEGQLQGEGPIELKVKRDGNLGAFQLSFQVMLPNQKSDNQSEKHTHLLVINKTSDKNNAVTAGTTITGSYALFKDSKDREYTFSLSWNQSHQSFKITN